MTLQEFINKYNGVPNVGDTPQNMGQCVGLIELWTDSLGLPHTWGNAKDLLADADPNSFDIILNNPNDLNQYPPPGDVICWDSTWGAGAGHTGIVVSADGNSFSAFEQNNPGAPQINHHNDYSHVLGWLHPKVSAVSSTVAVDSAKFAELVGKSTKYDAFTAAGYNTIDDVNKKVGDLTNDRDEKAKVIVTLNSKIDDLTSAISKDTVNDQDLQVKNTELEKQNNEYQQDLLSIASALSTTGSFPDILGAIDILKKPIDEQVKPVVDYTLQVQKALDGNIYKRAPKAARPLLAKILDKLFELYK